MQSINTCSNASAGVHSVRGCDGMVNSCFQWIIAVHNVRHREVVQRRHRNSEPWFDCSGIRDGKPTEPR